MHTLENMLALTRRMIVDKKVVLVSTFGGQVKRCIDAPQ